VVGALGREIEAPGERQLHRDVARQLAWQAEQPARGGDEVALDLRDAEHRGARRDQQIARQRDLGAAGERRSVDRGDDRLRVLARDDAAEAAALGAHAAGIGAHLLQVGAGAEDVALGGLRRSDADLDLVVGSMRSMASMPCDGVLTPWAPGG
jgi:hypothetical protein